MKKLIYTAVYFILFFHIGVAQTTNERALIISVGGARAAWGAGFAKAMYESGRDYRLYGGTSAGALIMGPIALKKFDQLETLFQHITNRDVYNVNPLTKKGNFKFFKNIWRGLIGRNSLGETKKLRLLLEQMISEKEYQALKSLKTELFCITTNFGQQREVVKCSENESYSDMLDWIWASSTVPVIMKPLEKEGQIWVDGGLVDNTPIDHAFQRGVRHIDVICLYPEKQLAMKKKLTLSNISMQLLHTMITSNEMQSSQIAQLLAKIEGNVQVHYYYMPQSDAAYLSNLFSFDHNVLAGGFDRGCQAFKKHPFLHQVFKSKQH